MMHAVSKQSPWEIQKAVVFALFMRELKARFGRYRIGYIWALLEPVIFVVVFSFIRGRFGGSNVAGLPPILFFASGILMFFIFRNIVSGSLGAVEANLGVFNYQRVKPADVVIARALLEVVIILVTSLLLFGGFALCGYPLAWNDPLGVLGVLACLLMLSLGVGLVCSIVGPIWQDSQKILPMIIRLFLFISGIMFPANAIPESFRAFAMWNPVLHALELMRGALFAEYSSHEGNWFYLLVVSLLCLLLGLTVYRLFRVTVVTSGYIR